VHGAREALAKGYLTPSPFSLPASTSTVDVVPPVHGTLQLVPALPPDGKYPAGTVVTLKAFFESIL
jgi:hypothetical protein